jgi:site-specific DNA-methyltransferase (cytosine-N4-specific)
VRPYFHNDDLTLYCGDAAVVLSSLDESIARTILTSPPYWNLRDYGVKGQLGAEATPAAYVAHLTGVFRAARHVLTNDGTVWLNLGDSYVTKPGNGRGGEQVDGGAPHRSAADKTGAGLRAKNLVGIPWRSALGLQDDGWILRSDVIWEKPNAKPDGAKDRPTASHEYLFLLARNERYHYDAAAVAEPSTTNASVLRNRRTVWKIPTAPYKGAHFACWPPALAELLVKSTSRPGDAVLDPFFGAGTTALAARSLGRRTIGIELNPDYCELALERLGYR